MRLKSLFILFSFSVLVWSCKPATPTAEVSRVEIKDIVNDSETTFVDVRIPEQFAAGSVEGAVNIPLATISDNLDYFRDKKEIVLFCNSGRQSGEAMEILKKNGITNVSNAINVKNIEAIKNETK